MRIWGGGLAMELIDCVDGLTLGPRRGWTPEDEDTDEDTGQDIEQEGPRS
ncbi:hypothetical protein OS122_29950 [Mycolicibacterium mucogenicum]|nr:hypothetical protein [Mycolicibacterium mucogenicum]MCX8565110.1 hypothetical protein [Mycolicibacterium mucogenicum]